MGILRFAGYWCFRHLPPDHHFFPGNVEALWIDMNGIIHKVREEYKEKKLIFPQLVVALTAIIARVVQENNRGKPLTYLILAVDGVPPLAKMVKQRQGRFRSAIPSDVSAEEAAFTLAASLPKGKDAAKVKKVSSNEINPGTSFMIALDKYLRKNYFAPAEYKRYAHNLIYSSHLVVGEGEHKIMDMLRSPSYSSLRSVVYGLDADLIQLTLCLPPSQKEGTGNDISGREIYLLRDEMRDKKMSDGSVTKQQDWFYYSIPALRRYIINRMGNTPTALYDFFFITLLMGNDFFPPQPSLVDAYSAPDLLIETYNSIQPCLLTTKTFREVLIRGQGDHIGVEKVEDYDIDLVNWKKFMQELKQREGDWLVNEANRKQTGKFRGGERKGPYFSRGNGSSATIPPVPVGQEEVYARHEAYNYLSSSPNSSNETGEEEQDKLENFRYVYYAYELARAYSREEILSSPVPLFTDFGVNEMAFAYLQQLLWCQRYYLMGLRYTNFDIAYQYNYAPLLVDVADVLENISTLSLANEGDMSPSLAREIKDRCHLSAHRQVSPIRALPYHQMMLVLPYNSNKIVPGVLRKLMMCNFFAASKTRLKKKQGETLTIPKKEKETFVSPIGDNYPIATDNVEYLVLEREHDLQHNLMYILPDLPYYRVLDAVDEVVNSMEEKKQALFRSRYYPGTDLTLLETEEGRVRRQLKESKIEESKAKYLPTIPAGIVGSRGRGGRGSRGRGGKEASREKKETETTRGRGQGRGGRGRGMISKGLSQDGNLPTLM